MALEDHVSYGSHNNEHYLMVFMILTQSVSFEIQRNSF